MKFYTYILYDSNENPGSELYVGKGTRDRIQCHVRDALAGRNGPNNAYRWLYNKIRKIYSEGRSVVAVKKYESDNNLDALTEERNLIKLYGRKDIETGILYNQTDGGDGPIGMKHTEKTKRRISEAHTGSRNHFYGKKHSDKTKEMIRKSLTGRFIGENNPRYGKKLSEDVLKIISKTWFKEGNIPSNAKLTEQDVIKIRQDNRIQSEIAKSYNVSVNTVYRVKHRISWKNTFPKI